MNSAIVRVEWPMVKNVLVSFAPKAAFSDKRYRSGST
jgi:hypothetical protein